MTALAEADRVDRIFQAMSDRNRRAIVDRLSRGPASISDVARPMDMSLAGVVQHIQVLEQAGILRTEKSGRVRTCHFEPDSLKLLEAWVRERLGLWEKRYDRLGKVLDDEEDG